MKNIAVKNVILDIGKLKQLEVKLEVIKAIEELYWVDFLLKGHVFHLNENFFVSKINLKCKLFMPF